MKFSTGSLPIGFREYTFSENVEDMNLDERFHGNVDVIVHLEKTERFIELRAEIRANANLVCDRCAEEFTREIDTKYRMVYLLHESDVSQYSEEDTVILTSEYTVIDISEDVRQFLLLTIPLKLLCSEDCKGLCPVCGINLNTDSCNCKESYSDPRWEKLNKLMQNN
jgi:uncharacterized protein